MQIVIKLGDIQISFWNNWGKRQQGIIKFCVSPFKCLKYLFSLLLLLLSLPLRFCTRKKYIETP